MLWDMPALGTVALAYHNKSIVAQIGVWPVNIFRVFSTLPKYCAVKTVVTLVNL